MNQTDFDVILPQEMHGLQQDEEFCVVVQNGRKQKIRFHDYHEIYKIPGLYEHLFHEKLKSNSHVVVPSLLKDTLDESPLSFSDLSILELGAGNGLVGEVLADYNAKMLVGVDIIDEAAEAAQRDRPDVYDRYYIGDICELSNHIQDDMDEADFNCLVCVAALGFGDIPVNAFTESYNLIADDGWVAFNIKADFVGNADKTGFASLLNQMEDSGMWNVEATHHYTHRLTVDNQPAEYIAFVGQKNSDIPAEY